MFSRFTKFIKKEKIYLDYASIAPVDSRVLTVMNKLTFNLFQNPGSLYSSGVKALKMISSARVNIAKILSGKNTNTVHSDEIIFTSGGTESNNIAIQGVIDRWYEDHDYNYNQKPHIVISEIEHPSVRNIVENLSKKNKITFSKIKINNDGVIDIQNLKEILSENKNTILVSVMLVNNEIGSIQPIKEIASVIRKIKGNNIYPLLHTDACQAVNYLDMQFDKMGIDLLSLDGGKIYGPRGSGILYIKRKTPINPVYFGGDQEYGIRPGTENLSAIVGIEKALEIIQIDKEKEIERLFKMQQYIFSKIKDIKNVSINGSIEREKRIVNNINICFKDKDSEFLLFKMDKLGFEISTGTTCQNKKEESRSVSVDVLGNDCGASSLRISLGRWTTWGEVRGLLKAIDKVAK